MFSQFDAFPSGQSSPFAWDASLLLFLGAIGVSLVLTVLLWLATRFFLRRPFPHSVRSLLILVACTSTILICAAWYAYPVPYSPSSRGVFLRDMLRATQSHQELSAVVRERMFDMCSTREGSVLAEAVYAMVLAGVATPDQLQTKLTSEESADMLALGLFYAGNHESAWWQRGQARAFWDRALSVAQTRRLKTAISKRIRASERFWNRGPG